PATRHLHWLLAGSLTLLSLVAGGGKQEGPGRAVWLGALLVLMVLSSPVCHLPYFCVALPLVSRLLALAWPPPQSLRLGSGLALVLIANVVANTLPRIPALYGLRDLGVATLAALLLWLAGVWMLWRPQARRSSLVLPIYGKGGTVGA